MDLYRKSIRQFEAKEGKNFGECYHRIYHVAHLDRSNILTSYIEFRTHKETGVPHIISYLTGGQGYTLYKKV